MYVYHGKCCFGSVFTCCVRQDHRLRVSSLSDRRSHPLHALLLWHKQRGAEVYYPGHLKLPVVGLRAFCQCLCAAKFPDQERIVNRFSLMMMNVYLVDVWIA